MTQKSGFTLLELAVVLVIIGLVIGGVIAGRALVRASETRSMIGEYDSYVKAIQEFQDKYHALPGDMSTANGYWSNATNGDGSGTIGSSTGAGVLSSQSEWFQAWLQLADAGFVQGSFTGTHGGGGNSEATIGTNVPASKLDGGGWTINYYLNTTGGAMWPDQYGHLLNFGGQVSANYTIGGILRPDEAESIDQKLDDGMPGTGKVRAWRTGVLPNCTNETAPYNTQTTAIYNTGYTSQACSLVFLLGF